MCRSVRQMAGSQFNQQLAKELPMHIHMHVQYEQIVKESKLSTLVKQNEDVREERILFD